MAGLKVSLLFQVRTRLRQVNERLAQVQPTWEADKSDSHSTGWLATLREERAFLIDLLKALEQAKAGRGNNWGVTINGTKSYAKDFVVC
jgi:hypothetical protein